MIESIQLYCDLALQFPQKIPISPLIDTSYQYFYQDSTYFMNFAKIWFGDAYGPTVASTFAAKTIFSSGVFAMSDKNILWSAWARELESVFARRYSSRGSFHLAEQTALNYLLYTHENYIPLDAVHNYNCHIGCAKRDPSGLVATSLPPSKLIGIVHLTYSSKMIDQYIDNKLLFDQGRYLTPKETKALRQLAHY